MTDEQTIDVTVLKKLTPLNTMKPVNLQALARKIANASLPANQLLFKRGDKDRRSYWLISGSIELRGDDGAAKTIHSGSPEARSPLAPKIPRAYSARAMEACELLVIDTEQLDMLLIWDQTGSYEVSELRDSADEPGNDDWMTSLLQTQAFSRIPPANIQAIFMRMQRLNVSAGDVIIQQGTEGDFFYVVVSGECSITRETAMNRDGLRLATLTVGATFGEEALIADAKRNATVKMLTDGALMRLNKQDFRELISDPTQQWVDYAGAGALLDKGGQWLDVRLPSEFQTAAIPDAINIPLYFIRLKMGMLDKQRPYILYCDTGRRSAAAAFIMLENGFDAYALRGGVGHLEAPQLRRQA
jgi:CRP-like cAMP-binding protein/rhodanese-related sulfurtransferase